MEARPLIYYLMWKWSSGAAHCLFVTAVQHRSGS